MSAGNAADWVAVDLAPGGGAQVWVMDGQGGIAARGRLRAVTQGAGVAGVGDWLAGCDIAGADQAPILVAGLADAVLPRDVPCTPLPERLAPAGSGALRLVPVPALAQASPPDLAPAVAPRIAGWLAQAPDFDGVVLCLHAEGSVWAHVSAGEVVSFQSFVSGTLFAALAPTGEPPDRLAELPAFAEALAAAQARPERLAAHLASASAALVRGAIEVDAARARIAAALIGAELAAARPYWLGRDLALIGDTGLVGAYAAALEAQGLSPARQEDASAVLAGLALARAKLRLG